LTIRAAFDALFDADAADAELRGYRLQEFRQVVDEQVIGPLMATADAETDPVIKARIVGLAGFLSQLFSQMARQIQAGSAWRPGQTMDDSGQPRPNEVERQSILAKLFASFLKLTEPPRRKG
jgi:hypothetical protein